MNPSDTALLVIDVQEKLWPHISHRDLLGPRLEMLVEGARILQVPTLATEQYVRGLGPTIEPLASRLPTRIEKTDFSAGTESNILAQLDRPGIRKVLLCGIETHVCVQQTSLDLLAQGFQVYVAVDAVGSRSPLDRKIALERMQASGVLLTTVESVLFEWTRVAGTATFKEVSALVKKYPPILVWPEA
jgi:nicotinamidase-related amidase